MSFKWLIFLIAFWIAGLSSGFAQLAPNHYALILGDPPVSSRFASREAVQSGEAKNYRREIEARQQTLRNDLASRNIQVTGSVATLLNAVFVVAPKDREAELKSLPGVTAVVPLRRYRRNLNRATGLVQAPAAWNALNGIQNAGSGLKIGILDSGIDQTHPAFQDNSLPMPSGFPICSGSDCAFTNNKVIVARSYVRQLAAGSSSTSPAADSRPDDYSARDRGGHGTAVAMCAAGNTNTGTVTITGMAPKAYLGNYKIYGSPEVNDFTTDGVIVQALDDAFNDHMDIVSFSSGGPAFSGPLDSGSACPAAAGGPQPPGTPCDISAQAFENAVKNGLIIVAAAGNSGQDGNRYPTLNSIESPGDAPSVIAAGATTNSHIFSETVSVSGSGGPANLEGIAIDPGSAFVPIGAVAAPLVDVTKIGNDGFACSALRGGSLDGAFALIERGGSSACTFAVKLTNAQNAGAVGVIFYMADQSPIVSPGGLSSFNIPAGMISNTAGLALKSFIDAHPGTPVTIDAGGAEENASGSNELANFSSVGPTTGDSALKPDLVAVGTNMYMAAENYDPLGELYSSNRYAVADGTSFATPLTSGAAALVKQKHPNFTAAEVKSALVNTASQDVITDQSGNPVDVQSLGAGKLDAGAAVNATVTSNPATISFGVVKSGSLPKSQQLQIANRGSSPVTLSIAVAPNQSSGAMLTLDKQSLSLASNAAGTVTVTLGGTVPLAGSYSGAITLQASGVSLRVPYLYLVGNGSAANIIPLTGTNFDGTVNGGIPDGVISFKLVDSFGVPVTGAAVTFKSIGGGTLLSPDSKTDAYGIAIAQPVLGSQPGNYSYSATSGGLTATFSGTARLQPKINPNNGIVNAASFDTNPVAPGSYVSIFGTGLSDSTGSTPSATLPLAIDFVNVTFDVPSASISVPGRLLYVSPDQVNLQVPWELQGQTSAQVKVTIDYSNGNVVTLPLFDYAPAFFEVGTGVVAALDLTYHVIGASNPAHAGQVIQLFANGLGPVTNQPASGDPSPLSPLSYTQSKPVVTIGGQPADVGFSGLAPGFAGLYQINVTVPANLTPGTNPISVAIGGRTSKASGISVQ